MNIAEKINFDYNILQHSCIGDTTDNAIVNAYKLALSTELFDALARRGFVAEGMYGDKIQTLLSMDNIFENFFNFWITSTDIKSLIEKDFQAFLSTL